MPRMQWLVADLLIIGLLSCAVAYARPRPQACRSRPSTPSANANAPNNGCDLQFVRCDRKAVKLRRPGLADHSFHNGGRAIEIADWYAFVCPLDVAFPNSRRIPQTVPTREEKVKVKLRAYLLASKFEDDNDIHLQVGETPEWRAGQLVIEIPPGRNFCDARTKFMALYRADGGNRASGYKFQNPPLIEVTGYVFFDSAHKLRRRGDHCTYSGGRGFRGGLRTSPVRGIWEIHPVLTLEEVRER